MHERKIQMASRVGAFVALPGGYGTFEEVSWAPHSRKSYSASEWPTDPGSHNMDSTGYTLEAWVAKLAQSE